jgi:hypothetical protein
MYMYHTLWSIERGKGVVVVRETKKSVEISRALRDEKLWSWKYIHVS